MDSSASRKMVRGTAVAIGAWLVVIAAAAHEAAVANGGVIPVSYRAE